MIQLVQSDFTVIGKVAKHCNVEKLNIAINEAIQFDLKPLLCDMFNEVDANWDEAEGDWHTLINGGTYENCNGYTTTFSGLKTILTYFAYARYVVINNFDDTPNGGVNKTNEWSIPKPLKELRAFSDKYRTMAFELWKDTEAYLCLNKETYSAFRSSNCKGCGCNGNCGKSVNTKGFGLRSSNISKYDV